MKKISFIPLGLIGVMLNVGICAAQQAPNDAYHAYQSDPWGVSSVSLSGGPILTHHFQSGTDHFVDHHEIAILQLDTHDRGNWALYYLGPNSVGKTSIGGGYVTDPFVIPLGPTQLELAGALGLVSGYQSYPLPMLAVTARLDVYQRGPWNAGLEMAAMPYIAKDQVTNKNKVGIVGTTPFLSVRYSFQ